MKLVKLEMLKKGSVAEEKQKSDCPKLKDFSTRKDYMAALKKWKADQKMIKKSTLEVLSASEVLLKGRKFSEGTVRTWSGKKYKKVAGKWTPYAEGNKKVALSEDSVKNTKSIIDGVKLKSEDEYRKDRGILISFEPTYDKEARQEWSDEGTEASAVSAVMAEWDPNDKEWLVSSGALDTSFTSKTIAEAVEKARDLLASDKVVKSMKLNDVTADFNGEDLGEEYWGKEY